mgnify:CR=1 FL=1
MYNVLLKVKTRLVYTLSRVIKPYASGISTPSSEVVTPQSPSLITTCALKTGGNPKNISVMFGDSNDV